MRHLSLCVFVFLVSCVLPIFIVDVHVDAGIVLSVTSPRRIKQEWSVAKKEITPAVFGAPKYGSFVNGILFYPNVTAHRLACSPIDITLEPDRPTGEGVSLIWMVDRSPATANANQKCSFVTKVRNAQAAGAVAVVVVNRGVVKENGEVDDEDLVYMADDGSSGDVSAPAVMIKKSALYGNKGLLLNMWKEKAGDPISYEFQRIGMQITWSIPTTSGNVTWNLWTSAYDTKSVSLKHLFGRADSELHVNTLFTPRYVYYPGSMMDSIDCEEDYIECGDLCVNKGKYCHHDPDGDDTGTFTGENIVIENLWQSCVWDTLNKASGGDAHMIRNKWWSYVADFEQNCDTADKWGSSDCRDKIMDKYEIDRTAVLACRNKGGCRDLAYASDGTCEIIQQDINDRLTDGIFYMPTLVVNKEAIRGAVSCSSPITTSTCLVLSYICQGYNPSTRPEACTAPANGCNFYEKRDCASVCGGTASVDRCGICLGAADRSRDRTCLDCGGEIHGNRTLDACGICMTPNNSTRDTTCVDCKGVIHGTAKLDQCNVCEGDGKSCEQKATSWGAIIAIVLAISGVVGGAIYLYMRRQQNRMRDDIDGILKQYLPLDGSAGGGGGGGGSGHIRPTQRLDGHDNL